MSKKTTAFQSLNKWFLTNKRDLPWRENPSPYSVWISEVMLQQTRASVVIPYYFRFLEQFPSIAALANASEDAVIKAWEGLGYYSRVRNLHKGAKQIMEEFGGVIPSSAEDLLKIKGLGPYTVGAILNFAFHKKAAAVDGNVQRVCTRFFGIEDDIAKLATQKKITGELLECLPESEPWITSEALIELGATLCKKQAPLCSECPLRANCQALKKSLIAKIPYNSKKTAIEKLRRSVGVIVHNNAVLVRRVPKGLIMEGLYEFPYVNITEAFPSSAELFKSIFNVEFSLRLALNFEKHSFTRFQATLEPYLLTPAESFHHLDYEWHLIESLHALPFSSGHRKIVKQLHDWSRKV